jgi:two-component system LytT family response regulator
MQERQQRHVARRITLYPREPRQIHDRIAIPMSDRILVLETKDILFLKADSNYTHIHSVQGGHIIASCTLKQFERVFCPPAFLRIHKSYIIRAQAIREYFTGQGCVVLTDGRSLPVSRSRKDLLVKYLSCLMLNHDER